MTPNMHIRQLEASDLESVTSVMDEWWGGRPVRQQDGVPVALDYGGPGQHGVQFSRSLGGRADGV